jgi:hypothetical protein
MSGKNGNLIKKYRRCPITCVYCNDSPSTKEHVIGQAIGGRLHAPILCGTHNSKISSVDGPYFQRFAPIVNFLNVRRQDGQIGSPFEAKFDDGKSAKVQIDGKIPLKGIEAKSLDSNGKFTYVRADLATIERLKAAGKIASSGPDLIFAETPPPINFEIAADALAEAVALKTALHFVAGFICDVDLKAASELLPYVLGEKPAARDYVRMVFLNANLFERSWPPRHEVTCYPSNRATYLTVMHFGFHTYVVRLPFSVPITSGVRYRQVLGEVEPQFFDDVESQNIDWEHDITKEEVGAFEAFHDEWSARVMEAAGRNDVRMKCQRAAKRLEESEENRIFLKPLSGIGYFERYAASLQIEGFSSAQVKHLVRFGQKMRDENKPLWAFNDALLRIRQDPDF